ncbi:Sigma54 specific transcriptional regulator, Fis family [uncultured delta proteobacterium]|uniref:Sigma54 specific transcriptional regulator, Fis family n=1 Tax=uncultured delta proteobacterium TaxID=34034 RepID=A0A212KCP8_9DELT|nr:Sigma54 specific transcriptional regulator, Fis family [uncultured delta proteobacterium]
MLKILFLFPSEYMAEFARPVLADLCPEIIVDHCQPSKTLEVVARYMAKGVGIVGARGGINQVLLENKVDIPVVDIPVTAFDSIKAVTRARSLGKNIAVLALSQMVEGIQFLASSLGIAVTQYTVTHNQDYDKAVREAVANGAEVIVGGVLATEAAKRLGVANSLLQLGEESLLRAAREALRLQEALDLESAKSDLFRVVMNASREGILVIDEAGIITGANGAAGEIFKGRALPGRSIAQIIPQLGRGGKKVVPQSPEQFLVSVGKETLVCDAVPIRRDKKVYGAVFTFQQTSRIQQMEAMIREGLYARGHVARFRFSDIIGDGEAVRKAVELAGDYAETNSGVLILGETGTGKEVFAQSIHNASKRASGPFVAVNCAAIPTQLLESELFGYVGGAFTGASKEGKPGLFEVAHGGTIFLDEVAEMDYANQSRLLRFCQERVVVRLGSYKVVPVDVRIIAATNKNLEEFVRGNKFRDDLYHRLNVLRLTLPPLRERGSDIRLYAEAFLRQFAEDSGRSLSLSPGAVRILEQYSWPGNVRECQNVMERVAARLKNGAVTAALLEEMLGPQLRFPPAAPCLADALPRKTAPSPRANRQTREILAALEASKGNHGEAANALGIDRSTLYRRMKRLGLEY